MVGDYEEFSRTAVGGRLSPAQTRKRWEAWKADPTTITDKMGPNPDASSHLRVPIGKVVNFGIKVSLEKSPSMSEGLKKHPK